MSDSEKKKRNNYIKNRDRWIFAHTVIIVVVAIFLPYMKRQMPLMRRAMAGKGKGGN